MASRPPDDEILTYWDMCRREGTSLQQGMNFRLRAGHSILLTSVLPNAPYADSFEGDGTTLIYEGHDERRSPDAPEPKTRDQPGFYPGGGLTQNGKFYEAALAFKHGERPAERVQVYEKLRPGIWADNGTFHLVDAWQERAGNRSVFKFRLVAVVGDERRDVPALPERRRLIPGAVKQKVWIRDQGRCVECGATDELHFDHIIPYSRGGSSTTAENVQILCARHNLSKGARIS